MAVRIDLTLDCTDAALLAAFWKRALGYVDEPPPAPYTTRDEWAATFAQPDGDTGESDTEQGAWLEHPDGTGPRLSILTVPEPKTAKNRLHIDVRVDGTGTTDQRWARITAKADDLVAAGGQVLHTHDGHHIVMADPEGNEFCVAATSPD
jgi:hypothetical protein